MAQFANRFEALRAKARMFNDPDFVKSYLAGDIDARNEFAELTAYLAETGGYPTSKEELSVGEFSAPEA